MSGYEVNFKSFTALSPMAVVFIIQKLQGQPRADIWRFVHTALVCGFLCDFNNNMGYYHINNPGGASEGIMGAEVHST